MVSLEYLLDILEDTPVIAEMDPVSCCYLPPDVAVYETAEKLAWKLDMPSTTLPARALILQDDPVYAVRFPRIRINHNPFTFRLNEVLFERFDEIAQLMLTHSQLSEQIVRQLKNPDVVVFMLIDGLSYENVRRWLDTRTEVQMTLEPCLVDGPTMTKVAFPRIIRDTPLAMRLFDRGYRRQLGFTYWLRKNNPLTDVLFRTIPDVSAVGDFSTILATLRKVIHTSSKQKIYLQILRTGLDGYTHHQKRKPPITAIVDTIMNEMLALADLFREAGCTACIHLTADHGILWRDEFKPQIIGHAPAGANPRSCEWQDLYLQDEPGQRFVVGKQEIYCLGYPKLRRALRIDEQGVHGGISFQESIVPFSTIRIGDIC